MDMILIPLACFFGGMVVGLAFVAIGILLSKSLAQSDEKKRF